MTYWTVNWNLNDVLDGKLKSTMKWTYYFQRNQPLRGKSATVDGYKRVPPLSQYISPYIFILSRVHFPYIFSSAQISHFQDLKKKHSHFFTFFPKLFETFWKTFQKNPAASRPICHAVDDAIMSFNFPCPYRCWWYLLVVPMWIQSFYSA